MSWIYNLNTIIIINWKPQKKPQVRAPWEATQRSGKAHNFQVKSTTVSLQFREITANAVTLSKPQEMNISEAGYVIATKVF